jgi:hypothetical protein
MKEAFEGACQRLQEEIDVGSEPSVNKGKALKQDIAKSLVNQMQFLLVQQQSCSVAACCFQS